MTVGTDETRLVKADALAAADFLESKPEELTNK
jgi:hypothetical protein